MQNLAKDNDFFQFDISNSTANILAEIHATDSYQNILFSLLLYRQHTASEYPQKMTIISHDFKRRRFLELHVPALGIGPLSKVKSKIDVTFIGVNPPEYVTSLQELMEGEENRGYGLWRYDPYGTGKVLSRKRTERGWCKHEEEAVLTGESNEVVVDLVRWAKQEIFPELNRLPWSFDLSPKNLVDG